MSEWNKAIEVAIAAASSTPVYIDADGDDPDAQREASDVRNDIVDRLRELLRVDGQEAPEK